MSEKEQKLSRSYSFKMSLEEYRSLRDLHMVALNKGFNITLKGVIQSCIEIVSEDGIKENYFKFFEKNSRKA